MDRVALALAVLLLMPACAADGGGDDEMVADDEGGSSEGGDEDESSSGSPAEESSSDGGAAELQRFVGTSTLASEEGGSDMSDGSAVTITIFPNGIVSASLRVYGPGVSIDASADSEFPEGGSMITVADGSVSGVLVDSDSESNFEGSIILEGTIDGGGGSGTWHNDQAGSPTWSGVWTVELAE